MGMLMYFDNDNIKPLCTLYMKKYHFQSSQYNIYTCILIITNKSFSIYNKFNYICLTNIHFQTKDKC